MRLTIWVTVIWATLLLCMWFGGIGNAADENPNTFDVTITAKYKGLSLMDIALKEQQLRDIMKGGTVSIEFDSTACPTCPDCEICPEWQQWKLTGDVSVDESESGIMILSAPGYITEREK